MKNLFLGVLFFALFVIPSVGASELDQRGYQWFPYLEWSVENRSYEGNPYDLIATVTFQHQDSDETRETGMFYSGDDRWKWRFTATRTGEWRFGSQSEDPELDGLEGTVKIQPAKEGLDHGFLTSFGAKWGWSGTQEAMVPQLVMYDSPSFYYQNPEKIDRDIQTFLVEHGFNGFHTCVFTRWFDLEKDRYDSMGDDPTPDSRTFEALELLITKTYKAGGMVHLWMWGDEQRHMTPIKWGKNEKIDQRLQRYIAARLGPLPGWSMGYGFDLNEWVKERDLKRWYEYMHQHFGWHHFLGGRSGGPNQGTDHSRQQIYAGLDYSSYEHHQPTYDVYVAALEQYPNKPTFSEDRFRIRKPSPYPDKDYTEELTRRGLWISTMAGGVANIWGNLVEADSNQSADSDGSHPYPHPHWIKTYARFFTQRFLKTMERDNEISDAYGLRDPEAQHIVLYKEDTDKITMNLGKLEKAQKAIAIDTLKPYEEISLGKLEAKSLTWKAPYESDWAIAIGDFEE